MAYGYPFLTNDRKAHPQKTRRLQQLFPDAEFAWNNAQGRWEIVQPVRIKGGEKWSRVMILGPEIRDEDFQHLLKVGAIHRGEEQISTKDVDRERERKALADEKGAALEEAAARIFPIVMGAHGIPCQTGRIPVASTPAAKQAVEGLKRRPSGLIVPATAGV